MSRTLLVLIGIALARDAYADAKTQKMVTGYQREARSCKIQSDGVAKLLDGATTLQAEINDDDVAADIAALKSAQTPIQAFCVDVNAMIDFLKADPAAPYKSLEKEIFERDKKLRELRKAFKAATDGVTPIIRRLVPRINKRAATAGAAKKTEPAKTEPAKTEPAKIEPKPEPPKEAPKPPPPPPPPPVKVKEGPATSLSARSFTGGTCDDQAKDVTKQASTFEREPKKRGVGTLGWLQGAKWRASYTQGDRSIQIACVSTKTGGVLLTLEGPNPPSSDRELLDVAARALSATAKP